MRFAGIGSLAVMVVLSVVPVDAQSVTGEAQSATTATTGPSADARAIVSALISREPQDLQQLEGIVGSLNRDTSSFQKAMQPIERQNVSAAIEKVRADLSIDIYHQDPQRTQDPALKNYELWFLSGKSTSLKLLKHRFGAPRKIEGCACLQFGRFYFTEVQGSEGFSLAWYANEPAFATPERGAAETGQLATSVVAILQEGFSRKIIEKHLGKLTHDPDWNEDVASGETWKVHFRAAGSKLPLGVVFEFKRPVPAESILQALAVKDPVVVSTDVHMTTRVILDFKKQQFPSAHGYRILISVQDSKLTSTQEHWPASLVWRSPSYQINSIEATR